MSRLDDAVRALDEAGREDLEAAVKTFVLIVDLVEDLEYEAVPDLPTWKAGVSHHLRHGAAECCSRIAGILNTTYGSALWLLDDYVNAMEDAEQEDDPIPFGGWLLESVSRELDGDERGVA